MKSKWVFTPNRKRRGSKTTRNSKDKRDIAPWLKAILNAIRLPKSFLVLVTNASASASDRRHIDEQLAEQAEIQSIIIDQTSSGKELPALQDEVGCAPFTFSEVGRFYAGSDVQLAQSWDEEGMPTLIQRSIFPPPSEDDRRMAVLYAIGSEEDLENLESAFLKYFEPTYYTRSFSYALPSQDGEVAATRYFVQWELFPEEAAWALGVDPDSQGFEDIMDELTKQNHSSRPAEHTNEAKTPTAVIDGVDIRFTANNGWADALIHLKSQ